jgi:hypothetical protein
MSRQETPPDEPQELTALRRLLAEIAAGDYRDRTGHALVRNTAYLEAVTLLNLRESLGT